jgi:hypothetical protein
MRVERYTLFLALWLYGLLLATTVAPAHGAARALTEAKAEQVVMTQAAVRVPLQQRASLGHELQRSFALFRTLELEAELEGELYAAATFHHLAFRYSHELRRIVNGLEVQAAECAGLGVPVRRDRYRRFRCSVTSDVLTIPTATLVNSDGGKVPEVVEGKPRIVGPFRVRLSVRVTGNSTITYRQAL